MPTYEEQPAVTTDEVVDTTPTTGVVQTAPDTVVGTTPTNVVQTTPDTVVETRAPRRTVVANDDPVANAWAASQMIQTIVWSVVVLVLLVVALMLLHVYAHIF